MTDTTEQVEQKVTEAEAPKAENSLLRTVEITVSKDEVAKVVKQKLAQRAKTAKFPGFRPGKAPHAMVDAAYGQEAHFAALNDLALNAWIAKVREENLRVAGNPEIAPAEAAADDQDFHFTCTFEVYPEVKVPDLSKSKVTVYEYTLTDEDLQNTIDVMRKQRATFTKVERPAQNTDGVLIDFKGTDNGVAFQGGSAENYKFVLGNGQMLPEFESAILGMSAGETKTFPLTFPENYGAKELAGKQVQFEVTVKQVDEQKLPELDDAFAESLAVKGGVEQLKKDIRANLEREVKARLENRTKQSAMDALQAAADFQIPSQMKEEERQALVKSQLDSLAARGMDVKNITLPPEFMADVAEKRIKLGLEINAIVEQEKLSVSDEEIRALAEEIAQSFEDPQEVVSWYMGDAQRKAELTAVALENAVVKWIQSKAETTTEKLTFEQVMGRPA
jgi:trigger factor